MQTCNYRYKESISDSESCITSIFDREKITLMIQMASLEIFSRGCRMFMYFFVYPHMISGATELYSIKSWMRHGHSAFITVGQFGYFVSLENLNSTQLCRLIQTGSQSHLLALTRHVRLLKLSNNSRLQSLLLYTRIMSIQEQTIAAHLASIFQTFEVIERHSYCWMRSV